MKAAIRTHYGPPESLTISEVEKPVPKNNEVLIKVYATTVNRTDCGGLWGKPYIYRFFVGWPKPRHASTGTDFAGYIEAVGKDVTAFKPGDRVFGFNDNVVGSHAQYFTLPQNGDMVTIPDTISYEQAAASAEGAHYALNFINKVKLNPGDFVMVYGATGAIGSAAVQLLKYFGANVTAVCDTKNMELVRLLGADRVVDYTAGDFTNDAQKYHFVFDAVGKSRFSVCKSLLLDNGAYLSSELGPGGENLYLPLFTSIKGGKKVKFPIPLNVGESLKLIKKLLETGRFKPLIDRSYPLEQIRDAFYYVASGQKVGNVIITFDD